MVTVVRITLLLGEKSTTATLKPNVSHSLKSWIHPNHTGQGLPGAGVKNPELETHDF